MRVAPSHAYIHLDRLRANCEAVRATVGGRTVLAAVKADAYGHGAVPLANFMERHELVDFLGVATVPEALELRHAGVGLPILKLSHVLTPAGALAMIAADVVSACVSRENAALLTDAARELGRPARVHLKVDTGMRRIGVEPTEAADLAAELERAEGIELEGIFTHMPVSDVPEQDPFSEKQIELFRTTVEQVHERIGRELPFVHMANSGGVLAHQDSWLTMVRPGIMLYGYYPDAATPRTVPLEPVAEWRSVVSFVKDVPAGETVGYGRTFSSEATTRIATVPVGYADGYFRTLSNVGKVLVGGRAVPITGRVCMDQLMVEAPGAQVGDEVVLIGRQGDACWTADDIAAGAGTISYEVLCAIGARVPRDYLP